jgi:hypothetical protein
MNRLVLARATTLAIAATVATAGALAAPPAAAPARVVTPELEARVVAALVERHGAAATERARQGVRQVAERWWAEDGDGEAFAAFVEEHFLTDPAALAAAADRLEVVIEQITGHLHEVRREITTPSDLDTGPLGPVDLLLADVDLAAHVDEDLFRSRVAFLVLLNFPVHTLEERLAQGAEWDRETWARSRMAERVALRVPASVAQEVTRAFTAADRYIAEYYVRLDRLLDERGERVFPEDLRLITHWGLRDEIKSQYGEEGGLARQRLIHEVMRRIVRQEIPDEAIDSAELLWDPAANRVWRRTAGGARGEEVREAPREPDTRYTHLLDVFHAVRAVDPYAPIAPTFIERRFELDREIPEREVEALLVSVLSSAEFRDAARVVAQRLGRPLEPFDIWYPGFESRGMVDESQLDALVGQRYPDVAAFQADLPRILRDLGFAAERADWLAAHIVVDPARGAGHAMGAVRREDSAHLRTHFTPQGMDYKGYNIAIHELGHNVEQVFSLNAIDHWWLAGVPNNAFTEALAFVFQKRDLELLGLPGAGATAQANEALSTLWDTAEIGGVALVDMAVWRWMYEHPEATPAELREATLRIAREVWNRHFADVFGSRDEEILAIYSHMIVYGLYLPDYPLGHIIAFQLADQIEGERFGAEFERVSRLGALTPDLWMRRAVGSPISAKALLDEARRALAAPAGSR